MEPNNKIHAKLGIAMANNQHGMVTINGVAPKVVILDIVAQPVIISQSCANRLGIKYHMTDWTIRIARGRQRLWWERL